MGNQLKFGSHHGRSTPTIYRFDEFSFDASQSVLKKSDHPVTLRLQPARLLGTLLENAPETVSRKTLQDVLWDNGTTVEFEQGLNACVNQLRLALGDSAIDSRYIETLPKRGYRFVAPVEKAREITPHAPFRIATFFAASLILAIVAAWLFSSQRDDAMAARIYVAPVQTAGELMLEFDGLTQYALRLGTVERLMSHDLNVLRTINGVSLWRDLAAGDLREDVDFVLQMTLHADGDVVVVDATIHESHAHRIIDQQSFRAESLDVAGLSTLSDKVSAWSGSMLGSAGALQSKPSRAYKPEYFDAMVRARRTFQIGDRDALKESVAWFDKALAIETQAPDAKGGKAMALAVLAGSDGFPTSSTYNAALGLAHEIRQDSGPTAQSELVRGFIFLYRDWDLVGSRKAFDLAAEIAPGEAIVHAWRAAIVAAQGDATAAAAEADLAVQLDPLSMSIRSDRCWYLGAAGRYDEAVAACRWALELEPTHHWSQLGLVIALDKLNRYPEALDALMPLLSSLAPSANGSHRRDSSPTQATDLRAAYCKAMDLLDSRVSQGTYPVFQLAAFSAQCGRYQAAVELLEKALQSGESGVLFYDIDPRFDDFRSAPIADQLELRITVQ